MPSTEGLTRRELLTLLGGSALAGMLPGMSTGAEALRTRRIPSTGVELPVVGLGSWQTVRESNADDVLEILRRFHALGGRVVDTSPMYGDAETVLGREARAAGLTDSLFLATKVWTDGASAGARQLAESRRLLAKTPLDLVQVHNLRDWRTHLVTLRAARERGELRHLGITHYTDSAHAELERVFTAERFDTVQVNYNIADPHADERLLPAAAARGVAVIVNRPFEEGALFARVRGKPLPPWAAELGIASWGQYFLKWILGHPAVTCAIPATSKLRHLEDNLGAARGPLPDATQRARMREYFVSL
jgi:aryl-alcohol dehydrogenase-like predicted oxidoreductase